MNRDRIICIWMIALLVLELVWPAAMVEMKEYAPSWLMPIRDILPNVFIVLMFLCCYFAQKQAKAGWIVLLRATWIVFLLLWFARPLLIVWFPDAVGYQQGLFTEVMMFYGVLALVFTLIYMLVVPSFLSSPMEDLWKWLPVFDLSPSKGKTVEELKGGIDSPPRKLLFGEADRELVAHWTMVGRMVLVLSAQRKKLLWYAVLALAAWPVLIYFGSGGARGSFERDVVRMWQVSPSPEDSKVVLPTKSALNAARRVFADELAFRGLTRLEARELLGIERKDARYMLDKPEFSWQSEQLILRMSNGVEVVDLLAGYGDDGRIRLTWLK